MIAAISPPGRSQFAMALSRSPCCSRGIWNRLYNANTASMLAERKLRAVNVSAHQQTVREDTPGLAEHFDGEVDADVLASAAGHCADRSARSTAQFDNRGSGFELLDNAPGVGHA